MRIMRALAFGLVAGVLALAVTPAHAASISVDFQGTAVTDGDPVYSIDSFAGFFSFDVRDSKGNGGGTLEDHVLYRDTADYSNNSALYSSDESNWFEMNFTPKPGNIITAITIMLGGNPNTDRTAHYALFDSIYALLAENAAFPIDGSSGGLVTLGGLHASAIHFQFTGAGVGINAFSFKQTATAATTPSPGLCCCSAPR